MIEELDVTTDAPQRQRPGPKPKPALDLDTIAALIRDSQIETAHQIAALSARVEAAEAKAEAVPQQFIRAQVQTWGNRDLEPANAFAGLEGMTVGEERQPTKRLPISAKDGLIPPDVARRMPQRFRTGQYVRINPDATRPGSDRPWSEVLAGSPRSGGSAWGNRIAEVGVVKDCVFTGGYGWKYQCKFDGMVGARDHQDGFYESELLPA